MLDAHTLYRIEIGPMPTITTSDDLLTPRRAPGPWTDVVRLAGRITDPRNCDDGGCTPVLSDYVRAARDVCGPDQLRWDDEVREPLLAMGATLTCLDCKGEGGQCVCNAPGGFCDCEPCACCKGTGEVPA